MVSRACLLVHIPGIQVAADAKHKARNFNPCVASDEPREAFRADLHRVLAYAAVSQESQSAAENAWAKGDSSVSSAKSEHCDSRASANCTPRLSMRFFTVSRICLINAAPPLGVGGRDARFPPPCYQDYRDASIRCQVRHDLLIQKFKCVPASELLVIPLVAEGAQAAVTAAPRFAAAFPGDTVSRSQQQ